VLLEVPNEVFSSRSELGETIEEILEAMLLSFPVEIFNALFMVRQLTLLFNELSKPGWSLLGRKTIYIDAIAGPNRRLIDVQHFCLKKHLVLVVVPCLMNDIRCDFGQTC
jgi:hypothetical protein